MTARSSARRAPPLTVVSFEGRTPYRDALALQRRLARERIDGDRGEDLLLLMEHEPVLTLGRDADREHLVADSAALGRRGVELAEIERGGDVTYHGPGQLVGYPLLDLDEHRKDLHWYLRTLEAALVEALSRLGVEGFRVPEHTGVWVGERPAEGGEAARGPEAGGASDPLEAAILEGRVRKVASIGVHVSRWVTWHGFALNRDRRPMENFDLIVPCGIRGVTMTSLEAEGAASGRREVEDAVAHGFGEAFGVPVSGGDPAALTEGDGRRLAGRRGVAR